MQVLNCQAMRDICPYVLLQSCESKMLAALMGTFSQGAQHWKNVCSWRLCSVREILTGLVENTETQIQKETTMMEIPPPNPFEYELRGQERLLNFQRDRLTNTAISRRAVLLALVLVLLIVTGAIMLIIVLH